MRPIIVVGYPKSGNTWICRLLGDVLESRVGGIKDAHPLAEEGADRPGPYNVLQLHLKPVYGECAELLPSAWGFCVEKWDAEPIIHMVRDPRDIAVSVNHYWNLNNLNTALTAMINGHEPLRAMGTWAAYVERWLDCPVDVQVVQYRALHDDPEGVLTSLIQDLNFNPLRIKGAVHRQSFDERRAWIEKFGEHLNYGTTIQLHNLRNGTAGDWRNHFTDKQEKRAWEYFGPLMGRLGYER